MEDQSAKRTGRPLTHPQEGPRRGTGFRVRPGLKAMIDDASSRNHRSQASEIEYRLERSFVEDEAWKVAQLAASLLAGPWSNEATCFSEDDALDVACRLLKKARARVEAGTNDPAPDADLERGPHSHSSRPDDVVDPPEISNPPLTMADIPICPSITDPHLQIIVAAREAKGMTQRDLAREVGRHWVSVSKIERGVIPLSYDWAKRLARALDLDIRTIFDLSELPSLYGNPMGSNPITGSSVRCPAELDGPRA